MPARPEGPLHRMQLAVLRQARGRHFVPGGAESGISRNHRRPVEPDGASAQSPASQPFLPRSSRAPAGRCADTGPVPGWLRTGRDNAESKRFGDPVAPARDVVHAGCPCCASSARICPRSVCQVALVGGAAVHVSEIAVRRIRASIACCSASPDGISLKRSCTGRGVAQ